MLTSGSGIRQIARVVGLDARSIQGKLRKYGTHSRLLHQNLSRRLPENRTYILDEEETFEHASIRPLTVPILIESKTWFIIATAVGPIRRLAPAGTARRRKQEADEKLHGRRRDESARRVREVLEELRQRAVTGPLLLFSDDKPSYRLTVKQLMGDRAIHMRTSSEAPRTTWNPLFPINTTIAMSRDNLGRLRRKSWLVSKRREPLRNHLSLFTTYRNYIRRRFNRDRPDQTPAQILGLVPRPLRWREAVSWRQDWGEHSPHPLSASSRHTIAALQAA